MRVACARRGNVRRRRADKIDIQLAVFDCCLHGMTCRAIARKLRRPVSTVRSTFAVAWRNVFGVNGPPAKKKKTAVHAGKFGVASWAHTRSSVNLVPCVRECCVLGLDKDNAVELHYNAAITPWTTAALA